MTETGIRKQGGRSSPQRFWQTVEAGQSTCFCPVSQNPVGVRKSG